MNVEELIAKIAKEPTENPICWLVSYEDRPLQAEPSAGAGPHLLVFSAAEKANRFIELRKAHYHSETLKALAVDTAGNLKKLTTTKADDPDYEAPPCGLMLDFDYASGSAAKNLAGNQMSELGSKEISAELKPAVKEIPAVPMAVPVPIPTPEIPKTKTEGKGKNSTAIPNPPPLPLVPVAAAAGMGCSPAQGAAITCADHFERTARMDPAGEDLDRKNAGEKGKGHRGRGQENSAIYPTHQPGGPGQP